MRLLIIVIPTLIFWGIFTFVILKVPYPESLTQATFFQLLTFFLSLFLAITVSINIFLNLYPSIIISLGLILILILQGLATLNIVTGVIVLSIMGLLLSYFKKAKQGGLSFKKITFGSRIKKLKLSNKFKQVKLPYLRRRKRR